MTDDVDADLLLAVLNSTPITESGPRDEFADVAGVQAWLAAYEPSGTSAERTELRRTRDVLQGVVSGTLDPAATIELLHGVTQVPELVDGVPGWRLHVPASRELAVRAVLAWAGLARTKPGRLRACANEECRLFLLDRSKANNARWCSMASCGNRLKARRYAQRAKSPQSGG